VDVKLGATITIATAVVALIATASTAGAAPGTAHSPRFARHARHPLSASRTTKPSKLNCLATCPAYESTINQYFTDVAAASVAGATDNVYSVMTQYSGIENSETFDAATNSYVDTNPYPTSQLCHDSFGGYSDKYCVTDRQLQAEIGKVIAAHGWPAHSNTSLYFIFMPAHVGVCIQPGSAKNNACTTNAFCAYHYNANSFIYAVEPDAAAVPGGFCNVEQHPAGNSADATINNVSHEQIEAITDPFATGWYAGDVAHEIADLCAYDFGTPLDTTPSGDQYNQLINGHPYNLQLEYSNQDAGCVPYLGGPVTSPESLDPPQPDGSGPMTAHDSVVMTTNTIYAIYWVPAVPANITLPAISGVTKVGKTLKAANGTWSNGPPKFTYRWLRCSAAGTVCKGIKAATGRSYRLVEADAGHRLEVRVTATNMVGQRSATAAATARVKK
jgi:hypothetical protein